jgi:hypothetical protein
MDIEWEPHWPHGRERMELQADPPEPPPDRAEIRRQLGWDLLRRLNRPHDDGDCDECPR